MDEPRIIREDTGFIVIDKPAGLLVHSLPNQNGKRTLVDWLTEHDPRIPKHTWPDPSRSGIVHRLDRDTSGVMVLAKDPETLQALQEQFRTRTIEKVYLALVLGVTNWKDYLIRAAVKRGAGTQRKAQYFQPPGTHGKPAETVVTTLESFSRASLVEARPKTGRTHQIRVHLALESHPILGDPWYETKSSRQLAKQLAIPRLMLHAQSLAFIHPETEERVHFTAPTPADFLTILSTLQHSSISTNVI